MRTSDALDGSLTRSAGSTLMQSQVLQQRTLSMIDLFGAAVPRESASRSINYQLVDYIKYEFADAVDAAKKLLEHACVRRALLPILHDGFGRRSADIGCATGRYPSWFSSLHFEAVGYDIDPTAVEISKRMTMGKENVRIVLHNVLTSPAEAESYDVVTCMMGTFNHFSTSNKLKFLKWANSSARPGGFVVFSGWNPRCAYTSPLSFYSDKALDQLHRRMMDGAAMRRIALRAGFKRVDVIPAVFLPDDCYRSWGDKPGDDKLAAFDTELRSCLTEREAQILVCVARKNP